MNRYLNIVRAQADGEPNVINLYGEIVEDNDDFWGWGECTGKRQFRELLGELKGDIVVNIDSPGGDAFAGMAMYEELCAYRRARGARVCAKIIFAASAATIVAMAADDIVISRAGTFMVHSPWTFCCGNARELNASANTLEIIAQAMADVYADRTGLDRDEVLRLIDGGEENNHQGTWMTAQDALRYGFADRIADAEGAPRDILKSRVAACASRFAAPKPPEAKTGATDDAALLEFYREYFGNEE